jgi:hypothetical protein
MRVRVAAFVSVLFVLAAGALVSAQVVPSSAPTVTLSASPQYPQPGGGVSVAVSSYDFDLTKSTIEWTVNGTALGASAGARSIETTVGDLGQTTRVQVRVSGVEGIADAALTLTPASVDLLWEADTFVPPHYKGRARASTGSSIRLMAIPHLPRAGGGEVPSNEVTYTWRVNGDVVLGLSGRGRSTALVEAPLPFGTDIVSVEARAGSVGALSSVRIAARDPVLHLYEKHPLLGIRYNRAFGSTSFAPGGETSLIVVPYFAPAPAADSPRLSYEWRVNRKEIQTDSAAPDEITIDAPSEGTVLLQLTLTAPSNPFLESTASWRLTFGAGAGVTNSLFNPFRSPTTQ